MHWVPRTVKITSRLSTPEQYCRALIDAGFNPRSENIRRDFAIQFFKQLKAKTEASGRPPPIGLHILMQESAALKIQNMGENIMNNLIAPVEIIVEKN